MRQSYRGPEQEVHPGTEYARSVARFRPRRSRAPAASSYLAHPLAPVLAVGLLAAGAALLWSLSDHHREPDHDGDVDFADYPPS